MTRTPMYGDKPLTKVIGVRLTDDEYNAAVGLADRISLTPSLIARQCLLAALDLHSYVMKRPKKGAIDVNQCVRPKRVLDRKKTLEDVLLVYLFLGKKTPDILTWLLTFAPPPENPTRRKP